MHSMYLPSDCVDNVCHGQTVIQMAWTMMYCLKAYMTFSWPIGNREDSHPAAAVICSSFLERTVLDPGKEVCADPRRGDSTLGAPGPQWGTMSIS